MSELQPASISPELDSLARATVDSIFQVHKGLGPGLLESVYEACLLHELHAHGLEVQTQIAMPVIYAGCRIDAGLRLDMLVGGELIVEIKAIEKLLPIHRAQLLTYLKLANKRLGLLVNFNVTLIRDGIQRVAL
jgi:GxxExxY protein